jgi:hypothetical protein
MNLMYKPTPTQSAFHKCDKKEVLFGGGMDSGKSTALLADAVQRCEKEPGTSAYLFYSSTLIRETELSKFFFGIRPDACSILNSKSQGCKFPNGSTLCFPVCSRNEDPNRFHGITMDWLGFDNLELFTLESFSFLIKRVAPGALLRCTSRLDDLTPLWVPVHFLPDSKDSKIVAAYAGPNPYLRVFAKGVSQ